MIINTYYAVSWKCATFITSNRIFICSTNWNFSHKLLVTNNLVITLLNTSLVFTVTWMSGLPYSNNIARLASLLERHSQQITTYEKFFCHMRIKLSTIWGTFQLTLAPTRLFSWQNVVERRKQNLFNYWFDFLYFPFWVNLCILNTITYHGQKWSDWTLSVWIT